MEVRKKSGSAMSDRQMARAAVDGRQVEFIQTLSTDEFRNRSLSGFLVGMDDFHWAVVLTTTPGDRIVLVHKSVPFVIITELRLADTSKDFQERVARVGQAFWDYCKKAYFGHTDPSEAQEHQ